MTQFVIRWLQATPLAGNDPPLEVFQGKTARRKALQRHAQRVVVQLLGLFQQRAQRLQPREFGQSGCRSTRPAGSVSKSPEPTRWTIKSTPRPVSISRDDSSKPLATPNKATTAEIAIATPMPVSVERTFRRSTFLQMNCVNLIDDPWARPSLAKRSISGNARGKIPHGFLTKACKPSTNVACPIGLCL